MLALRSTRVPFSCLMCLVAGCSLTPLRPTGLAGPSELGLSVVLAATPDAIVQDGVSTSEILIVARDAWGQTAGGVSFRVDIQVDGKTAEFGTLTARTVATDDEGRAAVTYRAPAVPPPGVDAGTTVTIVVTPLGTDFSTALPRTVDIRLVRTD
jgi:hypothetical protein